MDIKRVINEMIDKLEVSSEEINKMIEEDFNPSDWSGGNYDDAYQIGVEHGEVSGKLEILYKLLSKCK